MWWTELQKAQDVTGRVAAFLGEAGVFAGWRLSAAGAFPGRLELEWKRPDAAPMGIKLERGGAADAPHRIAGGLVLRYRRPGGASQELGQHEQALVDAFTSLTAGEGARLAALIVDEKGPPRAADREAPPEPVVTPAPPTRDVTASVASLLEPGTILPGWRLLSAARVEKRLELEWQAADSPPLRINLELADPAERYYRTLGKLGLRYSRQDGPSGEVDAAGKAFIDAFARIGDAKADQLVALVDARKEA